MPDLKERDISVSSGLKRSAGERIDNKVKKVKIGKFRIGEAYERVHERFTRKEKERKEIGSSRREQFKNWVKIAAIITAVYGVGRGGIWAGSKLLEGGWKEEEKIRTLRDFEEQVMRKFNALESAEEGDELIAMIANDLGAYSQGENSEGKQINFYDRKTWKDTKMDLYLGAWQEFIDDMLTHEGRHGSSEQNQKDILEGGLAGMRRVLRRVSGNKDLERIIQEYELPSDYREMIINFERFLTIKDYPQNPGEAVFWQYLTTPLNQNGLGMNEVGVDTFREIIRIHREGGNFTREIAGQLNEINRKAGFTSLLIR